MRDGRRKRDSGVGRVWLLFALFFAVLLAVSAWRLGSYVLEVREERRYIQELRERAVTAGQSSSDPSREPAEPTPEPPPIQVDFELLQAENPDVVGWIYCPDTEVNYPVMHSGDNRYYLRRRSDGTRHVAGSIFADGRNTIDLSDENVIIYGHNMRDGSMFALLPRYARQEFYEAHPVWYLLTPTKNYRVELFAGFVTSTRSLVYSLQRENTADGRPITDKAYDDSSFRGVEAPEPGERTLTLSTCSYEFAGARYVVMGILREL